MDEITISLDDSPLISQPAPVLIGDQPPVVVQENFVGGRSATIQIGTVETLPAGSEAYVQNVGTETDAIFNMGIPQGQTGAAGSSGSDGADGAAATIQVGTVTTGLPDTNAIVTNVGTENAAVLDFTIPRGSQGERGLQGVAGEDGISPRAYVESITGGARVVIEDSETTTTADIMNGTDGTDGSDGFSAIATVTQTSTGATVSITDAQGTTTANLTNGTNGTNGFTPVITATAAVDSSTGTPSVSVYKTGTDEYPQFDFAFSGLKGADGSSGITETSSGDNYCWKYDDGRMVCWGQYSATLNINQTYENAYFANSGTVSFAGTFISAPFVVTTPVQNGSLLSVNVTSTTTTGFGAYIWKTQAKSSVSLKLNYIAFGHWK